MAEVENRTCIIMLRLSDCKSRASLSLFLILHELTNENVSYVLINHRKPRHLSTLKYIQHKNLGLSTTGNFLYFEQLFQFRATFCILSNFSSKSSNSDISKQLLVLRSTFLPYFTLFQSTIYEFPLKKSSIQGQTMGSV